MTLHTRLVHAIIPLLSLCGPVLTIRNLSPVPLGRAISCGTGAWVERLTDKVTAKRMDGHA
jgi:hypothetical protein